MHQNSKLIFDHSCLEHFSDGNSVLEIGPRIPSWYKGQVQNVYPDINWNYADIDDLGLSLDISSFERTEKIDFLIKDGKYIDVGERKFDVVFSAQVIEHVPVIWDWVKECARVLKPGGKLVIISPISWPYHEAPVDCWRIHPEGMKALCEYAELELIFSQAACLEAKGRRIVPGTGRDCQSWKQKLRYDIAGLFGNQIEASIDLATVATKKLPSNS